MELSAIFLPCHGRSNNYCDNDRQNTNVIKNLSNKLLKELQSTNTRSNPIETYTHKKKRRREDDDGGFTWKLRNTNSLLRLLLNFFSFHFLFLVFWVFLLFLFFSHYSCIVPLMKDQKFLIDLHSYNLILETSCPHYSWNRPILHECYLQTLSGQIYSTTDYGSLGAWANRIRSAG